MDAAGRMSEARVIHELRIRREPMQFRSVVPPPEDWTEEFAQAAATRAEDERVELVEVTERVLEAAGPGDRIDPWAAIEAPFSFFYTAPDGTPWKRRAGEFADVALANGHELVWREGVMKAAASRLRQIGRLNVDDLTAIIGLLEQKPPPAPEFSKDPPA